MNLNDEDRENLSPEEIEALESEGDDLDEATPDDDTPPGADEHQTPQAEHHEPPPDEDDEPAPAVAAVTIPAVPADELARLKAEAEQAHEAFEEGDLTVEDYMQAQRAYERASDRNRLAAETNAAARDAAWQAEQARFFRSERMYAESPGMQTLLADHVNRLINDIAAGRVADMTDRQLLAEGRKRAEATMDPEALEVLRGKYGGKGKARQAGKGRGDSLAKHRAAAEAAVNRDRADRQAHRKDDPGRWDYLDRLDGAAFERELSKLSEAELEEYEAA